MFLTADVLSFVTKRPAAEKAFSDSTPVRGTVLRAVYIMHLLFTDKMLLIDPALLRDSSLCFLDKCSLDPKLNK